MTTIRPLDMGINHNTVPANLSIDQLNAYRIDILAQIQRSGSQKY
jgi:hypothetical protein